MSQDGPIRVILVDDHKHIHDAVSTLLNQQADIQLVGQASNGFEVVRLCDELKPDVILMDVVMPGMNGVEATRQIREKHPHIKILVLSSFQDDASVHEMLANGANGYVLKGAIALDLADTIRTTYQGKSVFSNEVAQMLLRPNRDEQQQTFGLTDREQEVIKLMADGLNNNEIAHRLFISRSTVKFHIANIVQKMGVETRAEAIVLAAKNGLI
ncbi:MAG: response regulator transcription factor [Anaerolineales bacterium]|nr:response regulator transcription factor [Anaerolineales bacterium]